MSALNSKSRDFSDLVVLHRGQVQSTKEVGMMGMTANTNYNSQTGGAL